MTSERAVEQWRKAIDDLYAVFAPDVVLEADVEAVLARIVALDAATPAPRDDGWEELQAKLLAEFDGSECPACHHRAHDPGSCSKCPRCELHTDEALAFVLRYEPELLAAATRLAAARGEPEIDVEQQERFKWKANERADRAEAIAGKLAGALSRVAYVTFGPDRGFDQPEGSRSPDGLTWVSAPRLRALLDEYNRLATPTTPEPGDKV